LVFGRDGKTGKITGAVQVGRLYGRPFKNGPYGWSLSVSVGLNALKRCESVGAWGRGHGAACGSLAGETRRTFSLEGLQSFLKVSAESMNF